MFESKQGQRVPSVTFHTRNGHEWMDVNSGDIFKGRTVAVFSFLPGRERTKPRKLPARRNRALKGRSYKKVIRLPSK